MITSTALQRCEKGVMAGSSRTCFLIALPSISRGERESGRASRWREVIPGKKREKKDHRIEQSSWMSVPPTNDPISYILKKMIRKVIQVDLRLSSRPVSSDYDSLRKITLRKRDQDVPNFKTAFVFH
ncbi:hypothetical protein Q8A67_025046 [Cirrhinus molitorella]|uniref:Uncharacterized protein n=1 Tax=Cirrhinus molitorella TaxID=172907 RepID=A0AA88NZV2_9TELE|nr:hypothetical protein Q8A67_025046 [Cirrhinus molitorella]